MVMRLFGSAPTRAGTWQIIGARALATSQRSGRADARRVLNIDVLDTEPPPNDQGPDPKVNVVIIDQGLNKDAIKTTQWGGGWKYKGIEPGSAERKSTVCS